MDRASIGISAFVVVFTAAVFGSFVGFRASWLLPDDFDQNALLNISGPAVGLLLVVTGVCTFWGCRVMLGRHAKRLLSEHRQNEAVGPESLSRGALLSQTALFAVLGICIGVVVGAATSWILIAVDGMGNGGDTSIVQYRVGDFVKASLWGIGVFLVAVMSLGRSNWSTS